MEEAGASEEVGASRRWQCFLSGSISKCEAVQGTIQTLVPDVLKSHEVDEVLEQHGCAGASCIGCNSTNIA